MPIDFSNYFKELRKRREPTETFWNRKPPMPDFDSEENQGWLQEVLGRLRERFEEKKATLGRVGEYAGALGKAALPQEYGTRSDLLDILGRVQKVPVPEGTELPVNIFTALKELEAWEARRAAEGIARYREAGGIGEAPIFPSKGSETWEQRLKKSQEKAERAKEFEESTFAPKGTTGEYVERLAQGVLDIAQFVPGAGIVPGAIKWAGKGRPVLKALATPKLTEALKGLQGKALKFGLDVEAIEGIAPGEFWVALTHNRKPEASTARFEWLKSVAKGLSKESENAIAGKIVNLSSGSKADPELLVPFKSLEDVNKFIDTGDVSLIAKKIELKGAPMSAEEFAKTKEAMARMPKASPEVKALEEQRAKLLVEMKSLPLPHDKAYKAGEWARLNNELDKIDQKLATVRTDFLKPEVPPVAEGAKAVAKEPWQMTREAYIASRKGRGTEEELKAAWHSAVYQAQIQGKEVPKAITAQAEELARKVSIRPEPQAWEMSLQDWAKQRQIPYETVYDQRIARKTHEGLIKEAIAEGKPVSYQVLKDYPELAKAVPAKAAPTPEVIELPTGWRIEIGKVTIKPGMEEVVTGKAMVDWQRKVITVSDASYLRDPSIIKEEIAHIRLEELPGTIKQAAISEFEKAAKYEPIEIRSQFARREGFGQEYGNYLVDPSSVSPEIASVFEKYFPPIPKAVPEKAAPVAPEVTVKQQKAMQWIKDEEIVDLSGKPIDVNPDGTVTLYHRTSQESADQMNKTGKFLSKENTNETFFSNKPTGQAEGYGDTIVTIKVPAQDIHIDDAFKNEIHVTVSNKILNKTNIIPEAVAPVKPVTPEVTRFEAVAKVATDAELRTQIAKSQSKLSVKGISERTRQWEENALRVSQAELNKRIAIPKAEAGMPEAVAPKPPAGAEVSLTKGEISDVIINRGSYTDASGTTWRFTGKKKVQNVSTFESPSGQDTFYEIVDTNGNKSEVSIKEIIRNQELKASQEVPPIPPEKPPVAMGAPEIPPEAPKPAVQAGKLTMVDLQSTEELVDIAFSPNNWRKLANRPVVKRIMALLNPSSIANDPTTKGIVLRAALRDEGQQKAKGVMAYLTELGTQEQTFGKLDDAGRIAEGNLKGLSVNDIRSNPGKYVDKLTDAQNAWIQRADDIERAKLDFLKRNGIEVNELSFEEGGQFAGRRVLAKLDKEGNIIAEGRVGAGPGRPGAKLSVEKTRYFETAEEAIKDGYRYLPDDEALYLNVQGAYNRIADKKMADWVVTKIPWRTTAAPEEVLIAREVSKIKRDEARRMVGALNRAVRGERVPGATINAISSAFPEQAQKLQDLIPSLQKGEAVADKVKALTQEARQLLQESNMGFLKADNAAIKAREQARRLKFGEAMVRAPAFQGKILTGPEAQEAARVLNKAFEPDFVAALNSINKANAIGRYFALAGDASVFGIQLSMAAVTHPKAFAQAVGGFTRALFDTRFQSRYLAAGKDVIDRHPGLLLASNAATEYTEAFAKYGMLGAKKFRPAGEVLAKSIALAPGRAIGKVGRILLEPFQRAFETALDIAGIEIARGLEVLAKNAGDLAQIDQFVNEFRGITSSAKLGVSATQRQLETVVFLAPRYNRAIAALLFDSIRGNLRGQLARQALLRTTAGVTALGVAIGLARGETWAEILDHFNPESSDFVTWEIAGQKVGPGTKMRSVLKLAGNISRKVREGKADDFIEISPANPLSQFVRGNLAPVPSTGIDLLSGRNYIGDPTRDGLLNFSKTVLAENLVPIWLQSTLMEGGDATQRILRGTTEFFGGRAYPDPYLGFENEIRKYNKIPTDPLEIKSKKLTSREDTRRKDPDLDAKLFVTGQTTSVLTPEAGRIVMQIIQEKKIDPMTIPGVKRNKELLARQEELGLPNVRVTQTEALTTGLTGGAYAPPGGAGRRITGRRITRTTMPSPLAGRRARRLAVRKTRRTTMPSPLRR